LDLNKLRFIFALKNFTFCMNIWLFALSPLLFIVLFVVAYIIFAYLFKIIPVNRSWSADEGAIEIAIVSNGVHTDLIVPLRSPEIDWTDFIHLNHFQPGNPQYIGFGWGDKGFYMDTPSWAELKFSTAFKALFHLGSSAVMVILYDELPQEEKLFSRIRISREAYQDLIEYLKSSFDFDKQGTIIPISFAGMPAYDHLNYKFYEGAGRYHFFKTCNCWANTGLKVADVKTGVWTPFAPAVFYHLPKLSN
jgi:uncharacterized protein (TIGR02117 family)